MKQFSLKRAAFTLLGSMALIAPLAMTTTTAQAKTKWTKGIPTALKGTWRSKSMYTGKTAFGTTETIQQYYNGGKSMMTVIVRSTVNPTFIYKPSYHHAKGSHYYYVKGKLGSSTNYYKFQVNGKKLRFKTYLLTNKKGKSVQPTLFEGLTKSNSLWLYKGQKTNKQFGSL